MKNLNIFISERLKLDKDSKISGIIPTKFSDDILYTKKEIDMIQDCVQKMKVQPIVITNYLFTNNELISLNNFIFMYYHNNWDKHRPACYLYFNKDDYENYRENAVYVINKKGYTICASNDLKSVCKDLIEYLDENDKFYNEVKKLK